MSCLRKQATDTQIQNTATVVCDGSPLQTTAVVKYHRRSILQVPYRAFPRLKARDFQRSMAGSDVGAGLQDLQSTFRGRWTFVPWLIDTPLTEAAFTGGAGGHTYAFYSVSRDLAETESSRNRAEATTTVAEELLAT